MTKVKEISANLGRDVKYCMNRFGDRELCVDRMVKAGVAAAADKLGVSIELNSYSVEEDFERNDAVYVDLEDGRRAVVIMTFCEGEWKPYDIWITEIRN
ncbi:MAG: hypothetical protein QXU58_03535 [Pyrobaculum sp.]|jgi:hypothetical protein